MEDARSRPRSKSRRIAAPQAEAARAAAVHAAAALAAGVPAEAPAPPRAEPWRSTAGEELLCELYAAADDSQVCGIMHEPTRLVEIENLPGSWPAGTCACDSARLPCGHVFSADALALHFLVSDMPCPVCRAGPAAPMHIECVPSPIREAYSDKMQGFRREEQRPEDVLQLRADVVHVLSALEVGLIVLGHDGHPRSTTRTRILFQPDDVDTIQQQVLDSGALDSGAAQDALGAASANTFNVHRSFQRLARGVVARQLEHNAAGRVRFVLTHPLVPVPIGSQDMSVAEAWNNFFNVQAAVDAPDLDAPDLDAPDLDAPDLDAGQPSPVPLFCASVAGTHPIGYICARFDNSSPAPLLTAQLNTLMLVNIAGYVRHVLESIRDAVELHTGFDSHTSVEITAEAINGLRFQL